MINKKKAIVFPILCIPVIAAIIAGTGILGNKDKVVTKNELQKVIVTSELGENFEYGLKDDLEIYSKIIENSTPVASPVIDDNTPVFKVNYVGTTESTEYEFIMAAQDHANCIYKNLNGEYYSIAKDDAYNLLLRNEFASAYELDGVSDLTVSYGDITQVVSPSDYIWNYMRVDGEFAPDSASGRTYDEVVRIPKNATFDFGFNVAPDFVQITANDGANNVYTGEFAGLPTALNYTSDKLLGITVKAKWYNAEGKTSYGEADYKFNMLYDVPATYELVDKRLNRGEFTIIKITNGNAEDAVTASSAMMDGETHAFENLGKQYIYVPISRTAAAGKYTITVNDPAGPVSLSFDVSNKNFGKISGTYSAQVLTLDTEDARNAYTELLMELHDKASFEKALWDGKFASPVAGNTVAAAFGAELNITGKNAPIYSDGIYYKAANGAQVKAANNGTVVFAGATDYTGNAVVIDHGLGVYSYYFNLGAVSCAEGDSVNKGAVIGTVGTSGVTPFTDTVFYANSVDGYFVNPETQIKYGISFG